MPLHELNEKIRGIKAAFLMKGEELLDADPRPETDFKTLFMHIVYLLESVYSTKGEVNKLVIEGNDKFFINWGRNNVKISDILTNFEKRD